MKRTMNRQNPAQVATSSGRRQRLNAFLLAAGFFSAAAGVVDQHGGVVVNYVGDALIAAFNAPLPVEDYPVRAISAARALLSLASARDFKGHRLRLRIGVATGSVAAGTVGGAELQTYTLYFDTVNLAQRLEQ